MFIDIISSKAESYGGSKFWVLVLDDCTDMCLSLFVKRKSKMPKKVVDIVKKLRSYMKYPIKHMFDKIWCDNVGENIALEILFLRKKNLEFNLRTLVKDLCSLMGN